MPPLSAVASMTSGGRDNHTHSALTQARRRTACTLVLQGGECVSGSARTATSQPCDIRRSAEARESRGAPTKRMNRVNRFLTGFHAASAPPIVRTNGLVGRGIVPIVRTNGLVGRGIVLIVRTNGLVGRGIVLIGRTNGLVGRGIVLIVRTNGLVGRGI